MGGRARWGAVALLVSVAAGATVPAASVPAASAPAADGLNLPNGFADELVTEVDAPTALAFLPEGRMLVATQPGRLYLHDGAAGTTTTALDLSASTCSDLERGLLGVATHPAFAGNGFVYAFYTTDASGRCAHRVSRFEMSGDAVDPATEVVLVDPIPSANANHNAGDLAFGRDGHLYVSVGDGGCDYDGEGCAGANDASRDEHVLLGKILRITDDGGIPPDNPFLGADADRCATSGGTERGRRCRETFAWGLRNPFRLAFDPNAPGTRFFINDVGQHHWEEVDEGRPGADYGWNEREGHCANGSVDDCGDTPDGMTDPVFDYPHAEGCGAITGGAFVPAGVWPDELGGAYLFGDYNCGTIFRLVPED
ncbi:MAG TPA: PQQ-dependent sugar dehydrogenase, partial [Acidimicrobiia bacterium]|nr:PQQ-dependent sugar dehydrogenase [Acidimicrobiia bacterium]